MDAEKTNFYAAADRAIRSMNRESLREFGQLKLADWDQVNVIRTVRTVYRRLKRKAEQHYYEIAAEGYILGLMLCGLGAKEAHARADREITPEWVADAMSEPDLVTGYRFDTEADRKAERLIETLAAAGAAEDRAGNTGLGRNAVIDKALRDWSRMFGQIAIGVTDIAMMAAMADEGVEYVMWMTAMDERVCEECGPLHGMVFPLNEVPPKPHWACRCRLMPSRNQG